MTLPLTWAGARCDLCGLRTGDGRCLQCRAAVQSTLAAANARLEAVARVDGRIRKAIRLGGETCLRVFHPEWVFAHPADPGPAVLLPPGVARPPAPAFVRVHTGVSLFGDFARGCYRYKDKTTTEIGYFGPAVPYDRDALSEEKDVAAAGSLLLAAYAEIASRGAAAAWNSDVRTCRKCGLHYDKDLGCPDCPVASPPDPTGDDE